MNQSNKYALISSVTLADDLADYLIEVCDHKCFLKLRETEIYVKIIYFNRQYYMHLLDQKFNNLNYGVH
jgi:hypothetical protein